MPSEHRKPIEELLEASAQARRAEFGGDPKMPNPVRALLQDEVARMARPREAKPRWFAISWPRLAMGAAFACLLLGIGVTWWQTHPAGENGVHLAMGKTAPATEMNRRAEMPAASDKLETAPQASMADSGASAANDNKTLELAKAAPAERKQPLQDFRSSAPRPPSADAVAQARDQATANVTQQFSQAAASKMISSGAKLQKMRKILDNFQVEQNGRDFRVVDGDGSTYAGRIEPLRPHDTRNYSNQSYAAPAAPAAAAKRAAAGEPASNNEYYFRASGYNASLKKSLVFEGNYIVTAPPGKDMDAATEKNAEQMAVRIVGTAKVAGEPPVPVDAVAVPAK